MNKYTKAIVLISGIVIASLLSYFVFLDTNEQTTVNDESVTSEVDEELPVVDESDYPQEIVEELPDPNEGPDEPPQTLTTLYCSDCMFAPVDKLHQLQSTYAPRVVTVNVSGGGQLIAEAARAAEDMFAAAKADGLNNIYSRSTYRSYATQEAAFEKWVGVEMANGYSRAEAESIANTYSAYPGQSEHQLGTTIDVLCSGCSFESSANQPIWDWLAENAEDYGFALSYPDGREAETGYTYEPWHYRYLGVAQAQAFNAQSKTLNNWLIDQGNY